MYAKYNRLKEEVRDAEVIRRAVEQIVCAKPEMKRMQEQETPLTAKYNVDRIVVAAPPTQKTHRKILTGTVTTLEFLSAEAAQQTPMTA